MKATKPEKHLVSHKSARIANGPQLGLIAIRVVCIFRGGQLQQFMSSEDLEGRCLKLSGAARAIETVKASRIYSLTIRPSDGALVF
jgi:hypothetical protein